MPADEVKVDRTFVRDMATNKRDACIVRSVIELGHNLGLRVVAEGVEDQVTLDLLTSWGCDLVQGFFLGHPLPAGELPTRLAGWRAGTRNPRAPSSRTGGNFSISRKGVRLKFSYQTTSTRRQAPRAPSHPGRSWLSKPRPSRYLRLYRPLQWPAGNAGRASRPNDQAGAEHEKNDSRDHKLMTSAEEH